MNPYTPTPIQLQRLKTLIEFLKTLPESKFDFAKVRKQRACGTVACAMGWTPEIFPYVSISETPLNILITPGIGERAMRYWEAASHLFGIEDDDAYILFSPDDSETPCSDLNLPWCDESATPFRVALRLQYYLSTYLTQTTPTATTTIPPTPHRHILRLSRIHRSPS